MFDAISHRIGDGILTITLNRPDNLNASALAMGDELERSFRDVNVNVNVNDNDDVRAVIVTGAGRGLVCTVARRGTESEEGRPQ